MTDINKQKFLAELGKLLTFMYDEDRQAALEAYSRMFDNARDEQLLLQFLVSPTRQAVVIARAYTARERKLQVSSPSRDGSIDDAASRDFMHVLDELEDEAIAKNIVAPEVPVDQLSLFGDEVQPAAVEADELEAPDVRPAAPAAEPAKAEDKAAKPAAAEEAAAKSEPEAVQAVQIEQVAEDVPAAPQEAQADDAGSDELELNVVEPDAVEPKTEPAAEPESAKPENDDVDDFLSDFGMADSELHTDKADTPLAESEAEDESQSGDKVDSFLSDFSIVNDELDGNGHTAPAAPEDRPAKRREVKNVPARRDEGSVPAIKRPAEREVSSEAVDITVRKPIIPLLILYTIIAVPVVLLCVAVLLIPTLLCLAVSALAVMVGCAALTSAFGAFTMFSDMMVVLGAAMLTLALGLLFLWFFVWLIGGAIAGLINAIIKLGGKWCYKEVPAV